MKTYATSMVVLLLHASWAMAAGNLEDGDHADLHYDPTNGCVILDASDTASGAIVSFVLATEANNMRPENALFPFINVGTNTDATTFQIGQNDPLNQGTQVVLLGNILPPGISGHQALFEYLTLAEYASALGVGGTLDLIFSHCVDPRIRVTAFLHYDPVSGNVSVSAISSEPESYRPFISYIGLVTNQSNLRVEELSPGLTDYIIAAEPRRIELSVHEPEPIELGEIFPPGLQTTAELDDYLTGSGWMAGGGFGGKFEFVIVPEPVGCIPFVFGMLMLTVGRNRVRDRSVSRNRALRRAR